MIVQAIYESKARERITENTISLIKTTALPNNLAHAVTSILYYDDWRFLQVVEGRPAQVVETMKHITINPIHHSIKLRLMTRQTERGFGKWPLGTISMDDYELRRTLKNMGYKNLFQLNVLDAVKVLKRTTGRKLRTMNSLEKRALTDLSLLKKVKHRPNLTEKMLGLRE